MNHPQYMAVHPNLHAYAQLVAGLGFEELMKAAFNNQKQIADRHLSSGNIDNIETGISGYLIFLLEYYKHYPSDEGLASIKAITRNLIDHCKTTTTHNYSFYTGRGGFVYFLTRLYLQEKDEALLQDAIELIEPCGQDYLQSPYTPDYLYNGSSGTLLLLLQLYELTGAQSMFDLVVQVIEKITGNGILSAEGISWKAAEEINLRNSGGFALGAAGILHVLKQFNYCIPNAGIDYCIHNTERYIESCWNEERQNWLNYSKDIITDKDLVTFKEQYKNNNEQLFLPGNILNWSAGKAGIQLTVNSKEIEWNFPENSFAKLPVNIYEGIAGIGLSLLIDREKHVLDLERISDLLLDTTKQDILNGGLIFGDLGVYYFLLRYNAEKDIMEDNILCPNIQKQEKAGCRKIDMGIKELKKSMLKKKYNRTLIFLEDIAPKTANDFLSNTAKTSGDEIASFRQFIMQQLELIKDAPARALLEDVFLLDNAKVNFAKADSRTNLQLYLDTLLRNEETLKLLNNTDEWLLEKKIGISEKVMMVHSKWDWFNREGFKFVENFYNTAGSHEYLFLRNWENRVTEYSLQVDGMVIHHFDLPKTIGQALVEIEHYCSLQPKEVMKEFVVASGSLDLEDFMSRLNFLVTHKVKQLIYDGILIFAV